MSFSLLGFVSGANSGIIRVAQTGDGTNGENWKTAYTTVSEALVSSVTDDQIWVKAGRYTESIVLRDRVSLYGGFSGTEGDEDLALRDWRSNETILDATGLDERVVKGADRTVLDGFTITNGYTDEEDGGAGVFCAWTEMTIRNCRLLNNRTYKTDWPASGQGGAIAAYYSCVTLESCEIIGNRALYGGGVRAVICTLRLENCLFDHNSLTAVRVVASEASVGDCTFGPSNGGLPQDGDDFHGGGGEFRNCIFRKAFPSYFDDPVVYSVVVDYPGEGNITADPQFVDSEIGDYRLKVSSPCIDSGSTTGPVTDLDGNPRPVDVLGAGRDGPGAYDMGCYEFQLPQADLNSDGHVNARDLFLFEEQWHGQ